MSAMTPQMMAMLTIHTEWMNLTPLMPENMVMIIIT